MTAFDCKIVIPARYASTRFPGKMLIEIAGEPMIAHVYRRACEAELGEITVATDDDRIMTLCESRDIPVVMTDASHQSGTDRVAEVATRAGWSDDTIVVCLQGDEPATPAAVVRQVANNLATQPGASIATLCAEIQSGDDYRNPNRVKVVMDCNGYALYFSRSPLPARRDEEEAGSFPTSFVHIGMYAYRAGFLRDWQTLPVHAYEREEKLEQLRALANGYRIHVEEAVDVPAHGVDRPEDVAAIEALLKQT